MRDHSYSTVAGVYIAMDLSMGIGPILWGALIDGFGFLTSFNAAGVISLCVIAILPFTLKKKHTEQAKELI